MKALENRIPPPVVLLITLLLIKFISRYESFIPLPSEFAELVGIVVTLIGFLVIVSGVLSFRKARTTVNPLKPDSASHLVKNGIFRYSRNPMYLGMALILLAASIYVKSVLALLLTLGFVIFISRFQILPEERAMRRLFSKEYDQYCMEVRRWF
jgi:protein-S-isoprenylcysteine O-methyltransferase Ste14